MSQAITTSAALGRAMRGYRQRAGLSLLRAAAAAGVHHTYLSRLEHGKRHPSARTLDRLVVALSVPSSEAEQLRALAGHPPRDPLTPLMVIDPALADVARGLARGDLRPEARAAIRAGLLGLAQLVTTALLALAATGYLDDLAGAAVGIVS